MISSALMFTWAFGFNGLLRKLAVAAGFGGMLFFEPEVVEQFPNLYANFFSQEFVAQVLNASV